MWQMWDLKNVDISIRGQSFVNSRVLSSDCLQLKVIFDCSVKWILISN